MSDAIIDVGEMSFWLTDELAEGGGRYEITMESVLPAASLRLEALDVLETVTLRVKKWDDETVIVRGNVHFLQYEPAPDVEGKVNLYLIVVGDYEEASGE